MTFEEAVRKSIKAYFAGKDPENFISAHENGFKYDRQYFDDLEVELLGEEDAKPTTDEKELMDGEY